MGYTHAGADAPALAGVDLDLLPGECLLVLGPSGSGKTTLALALAGLLDVRAGGRPSGEVEVGGPVGVVFQRPGDQVVMERVEDDVAFGLERVGRPREKMRRAVPSALAGVGLAGFERRRSMMLSGGEQQRLALAGAIAPAPPVLVLDEPTANLDPAGARAFIQRLAARRAGASGQTFAEQTSGLDGGIAVFAVEDGRQHLRERIRRYAAHRFVLVDHFLLDHLHGDAHGGEAGAFAITGLEHE